MKRIAILGASGAVGSALAVHILRSRVLDPGDELQLVGHGIPATEHRLLGTRIDLLDAFDDERVQIRIIPDVERVEADIVIVAAGVTISSTAPTRRDLAAINFPVFESIAQRCLRRLPSALVIAVSNPVELAVDVFCSVIPRHRVFGMGAQQDSLRFARAIAMDLAISRHDVRATVIGEHGQAMLPLWRSVELMTDDPECAERLEIVKGRSCEMPLKDRVGELSAQVTGLLRQEEIEQAYLLVRSALPDARIFVEPYITAHVMHSTPNATANATLQCLAAALASDRRRTHGQVLLTGEVLGIAGVFGLPLSISHQGWRVESLGDLSEDEVTAARECSQAIRQFLAQVEKGPLDSAVTTAVMER